MEERLEILQLALGANSPLAALLPEFSPREEQMTFARAVDQSLAGLGPLVAQVGTGTGKTLGYLVPALVSGLKTVVSTGTKTLQEQISHKELPLLRQALAPDLRWAVLKGRTNYLCVRKARRLLAQPQLVAGGMSAQVKDFWHNNKEGDLDQIRDYLTPPIIEEITSNSEQCQGARCAEREQCFLLEARRKAGEADIVVVNHHLFLADIVLKSGGFGQLLPRWQAAVFDEAHLLPEIATQAFGIQVSQQRALVLLRDIAREAGKPGLMLGALQAGRQAVDKLFANLSRLVGATTGSGLNKKQLGQLLPLMEEVITCLEAVARNLDVENETLAERIAQLVQDLKTLPSPLVGHSVAWARTRGSSPTLLLSPVEVASHLQNSLYSLEDRLVFTSATLAPLDNLAPYLERMGLDEQLTSCLSLASPFDLSRQAELYVPRAMPEPNQEQFSAALVEELKKLLALSRGRAFVLFTSHRNLEAVAAGLSGSLPYPLLVQGSAPKLKLIRQFIEQSPAVLLATASFWQGVDIPGPSLSAVIVDKLPFAPPDDPLVAARCALAEENGQSGFAHILLPEAILSLKQGLGRLIRGPEDRGILAVLDSRIWRKNYGKRFLKALSPIPVTDNLQDVKKFFD